MNIETNLSENIIKFLEKETYFDEPFKEGDIDFPIQKIISPIKADEILNYMLDDDEVLIYQEWGIVRANQIVDMKRKYEEKYNKDNYELSSEIFKYVTRKINGKVIQDKELNMQIPTLIDCLIDDFLYIVFNDYSNMENQFINNLLQVYLAGGWPCGWEGEYPKGRLVVFSNE